MLLILLFISMGYLSNDEAYTYALRRCKGYWRGIIVCAVLAPVLFILGQFVAGCMISCLACVYFVILAFKFSSCLNANNRIDVERYKWEERNGLHDVDPFIRDNIGF